MRKDPKSLTATAVSAKAGGWPHERASEKGNPATVQPRSGLCNFKELTKKRCCQATELCSVGACVFAWPQPPISGDSLLWTGFSRSGVTSQCGLLPLTLSIIFDRLHPIHGQDRS